MPKTCCKILIFSLAIALTTVYAKNDQPEVEEIVFNKLAAPNVTRLLEWITDKDKANICNGYYLELPKFSAPAPSLKKSGIKITAKKTVLLAEDGESELHGDVTMTQPGREIVAQKVTLYRDAKTGEVKRGALFGNVHLREHGKLVVANTGEWDFSNKIITFNNAIYHTTAASPTGIVDAWGRAKKAVRDAVGIWKLSQVSYSTCPPNTNPWSIRSSTLTLDQEAGYGSSINTLLYVQDAPVLYLPYFRFPLDKRRKSGFLYPAFGSSSISGFRFALPYYFNLAPNYDLTLTPQFYSRRGVLTDGTFRYLTAGSEGALTLGYIPHDSLFTKFRNEAPKNYVPNHSLSELKNDRSGRGFLSLHDKNIFNQHWSSRLDLNYVTDDYFVKDFGNTPTLRDNDQLLNQMDVNYLSEHWQFLGRIQAFQTLHPLTQTPLPQDQYMRLPQLDLNGDFTDEKLGFNYQLDNEIVNFEHRRDFTTRLAVTTGQRINVQPGIDLPLNWSAFYVDPKLQLPTTFYALQASPSPLANRNVMRSLPIFSVNSGGVFDRELNFFGSKYTQTLEPRLFYLLVPQHGQNDIPLFDTTLPVFNFEQLFRSNRFSGIDRIGDANQFAAALTTRFLDPDTAEEQLRASIGQIYQLHKHAVVCTDSSCAADPLVNDNVSPFVGAMEYRINRQWSTNGDIAWSAHDGRVSTGNFGLSYNENARYLFNVGYNFVRDGDPFQNKTYDLQRVNTSVSWLLKERWHVIGSWNYNLSRNRPEAYLYGVQYDNCCWAVRLVQSRAFVEVNEHAQNQFDNTVYLQFLLKGLGNVGNSDAGSLLTSSIAGYQDDFATGLKL